MKLDCRTQQVGWVGNTHPQKNEEIQRLAKIMYTPKKY